MSALGHFTSGDTALAATRAIAAAAAAAATSSVTFRAAHQCYPVLFNLKAKYLMKSCDIVTVLNAFQNKDEIYTSVGLVMSTAVSKAIKKARIEGIISHENNHGSG